MPESNDIDELLCEYLTLLTSYGQMQQFCSQHLHDQAQTIERLQTQLMQSRARAMLRESQLAWRLPIHVQPATQTGLAPPAFTPHEPAENESLEGRLYEADLVICQTGCLSHGAYWRVQNHCKRTGKICLLVEQPDALRIVRIQQPAEPAEAQLGAVLEASAIAADEPAKT